MQVMNVEADDDAASIIVLGGLCVVFWACDGLAPWTSWTGRPIGQSESDLLPLITREGVELVSAAEFTSASREGMTTTTTTTAARLARSSSTTSVAGPLAAVRSQTADAPTLQQTEQNTALVTRYRY